MSEHALLSAKEYDLRDSVREFISRPIQNFINGKWCRSISEETFEKADPATNEVIAKVAKSDAKDVDLAISAARKAFDSSTWTNMPPSERQNIMLRFADLMEQNKEELTQIECLDNGKNISSMGEAIVGADTIKFFAGLATKITGESMTTATAIPGINQIQSYTIRQPIGVVAAIIPWNVPSLMWISKVAPAIALGCTVVLKPAMLAPLISVRLMELLNEAGLPEGVVNLVHGPGNDVGKQLVADPRINKINFTGSTSAGKAIAKSAMENSTRVTLEMGGKSPSIIFEDADLEMAADGAANSIYMNCGQACVAGSRLFIQKSVFDQVVKAIIARSESMKIGPGMDPTNDLGPLIDSNQKAVVMDYINQGVQSGAEIVTGGKSLDRPGNFVQPTVFINVDQNSSIYREEIFGPVLTVTPFDNMEEVIKLGNNTVYGLAANIWTNDITKALTTANRLDAGFIAINGRGIPPNPNLPFGGFKQSGIGRENGQTAVFYHTELKTVNIAL